MPPGRDRTAHWPLAGPGARKKAVSAVTCHSFTALWNAISRLNEPIGPERPRQKCGRQDLNLHGLLHTPLKRARLPISPLPQVKHTQSTSHQTRPPLRHDRSPRTEAVLLRTILTQQVVRVEDDNHLQAADSSRPQFQPRAIADSDIAPGTSHLKTSRVELDSNFQDRIVRFCLSTLVPGTVTGRVCGESATVNHKRCMAPDRLRCMAPC